MRRGPPSPGPRKEAPPPARISVLLVDDQAIIRRGIRALLRSETDIVVVGDARNGLEGIAMAKSLDPDVVLMDIGMPEMNGIEATRRILELAPRSRVLILSAHSDDDYIRAVAAMDGVGYMLKQSSLADLAGAVRRTAKGGTVVSPAIRKRTRTLKPRPRKG